MQNIANYIDKKAKREARRFPKDRQGTYISNRIEYLWQIYQSEGENSVPGLEILM